MEIWKDIVGYEGLYQVSNLGRVKSIKRDEILKPFTNKSGYLRIGLYKNGKRKKWHIHRLVMIAFIGYEEGKQVNHIDGDKTNNRLSNLEWITQNENIQHAYDNGLINITKRKVRPIRCVETGEIYKSGADASRKLGCDRSFILKTCQGMYETCLGFHFEFAD